MTIEPVRAEHGDCGAHPTSEPNPWTDEDVRLLAGPILANFHSPDSRHSTWWLNTTEMAEDILAALAPRLVERERAAAIAVLRTKQREWRELSSDRSASITTNVLRRVVAEKFGDAADEIERGER